MAAIWEQTIVTEPPQIGRRRCIYLCTPVAWVGGLGGKPLRAGVRVRKQVSSSKPPPADEGCHDQPGNSKQDEHRRPSSQLTTYQRSNLKLSKVIFSAARSSDGAVSRRDP